jgi:hypothetical protein
MEAAMRARISQTIRSINQTASVVNAVHFTWKLVDDVLHWYHQGKPHHSIPLTEEQRRHVANGGNLECEYACGTVLIAGR